MDLGKESVQFPEMGLWPFRQSIRGSQYVCKRRDLDWYFLMEV